MTVHLLLLMRREGRLSIGEASVAYSLLYLCAICGKLLSGFLIPAVPRRSQAGCSKLP